MKPKQIERLKRLFLQTFPDAEAVFDSLLVSDALTPEAKEIRDIQARVREIRSTGRPRLFVAADVAKEFGCTYDHVVSCMKSHNNAGEFIGFQRHVSW